MVCRSLAHLLVGLRQRRAVQALLAAEVAIQHALAGLGARGNRVHPGTGKTVVGKLGHGRNQDVADDRVHAYAAADALAACTAGALASRACRSSHNWSAAMWLFSETAV